MSLPRKFAEGAELRISGSRRARNRTRSLCASRKAINAALRTRRDRHRHRVKAQVSLTRKKAEAEAPSDASTQRAAALWKPAIKEGPAAPSTPPSRARPPSRPADRRQNGKVSVCSDAARPSCPRIEAPATCPEGGKLKEAAGHGDILQEMDHLVLIAEVAVRDERGGDAPSRQDNPCQARLITNNEQYAADAFHHDRNDRGNERKRKAFRAHERHRAAEFGELLEPAQHEDHGKQEPTEESGCMFVADIALLHLTGPGSVSLPRLRGLRPIESCVSVCRPRQVLGGGQ
jgi:hypothetical protein